MFCFFLVIFSVMFQKFHNIGADGISVMKNVSYLFTDQAYDGSTTAFSVSLNNCVFSVTAAHNDCASSSCPDAVVHCDGLKIIAMHWKAHSLWSPESGTMFTSEDTATSISTIIRRLLSEGPAESTL